jgi:multiple antibiotic resistance protein
MLKNILLASIPVFVAVDAVGVLPIFISLTHDLKSNEKRKIIIQSLWTAMCLALGFVFLGKAIFLYLGITVSDFMIAGGIILFCIAITDLLLQGKQRRVPAKDLGVVPIGMPLIVGPAVLTTSLIIIDQYGLLAALIAIFANICFAGIAFSYSDFLIKILGQAGSRALSKIMALLLAAIAVMMIRGIFNFLTF